MATPDRASGPGTAEGGSHRPPPLLAAFGLLAVVEITAVALRWPALQWATKPLLAPVLALHLWRRTGGRHTRVLAGLGFATAGDVALLVPGTAAFGIGIAFFLGAQLCWISAFVEQGAVPYLRLRRKLCLGYAAVWAGAVAALVPSLDAVLGGAIAVYSMALVGMALTAHVMGPRAALGGGVFVLSDLLIGLGAAGLDFTGRPVLVMTTYAAALALLTTAFADDRGPVAGRTAPADLPGRREEDGTERAAVPAHGDPGAGADGTGPGGAGISGTAR
ncbi:lysoplasmalogenase [Streptomyces sp. NPDC085614]|uniref:lysoplasmalogenase n=1 Tax=Streptomyces sp. NPDC085614 TaxID=3365733 RepID=UPI0037D1851E